MASTSPPLKVYVTYLGGSFADTVSGMAVDSSGSQYVAGTTFSPDFPLTSTVLGVPSEIHSCAFVTKFNPTGTAIEISTCVANSGTLAFGLDAGGNIYLAVNQETAQGSAESVLKLDPSGQHILYHTPIDAVALESIAVDASGNVYLAGSAGRGLATTPGVYQPQLNSVPCGLFGIQLCPNAFVMKLNPSGAVVWATYLGGAGPDDAHAIAVDSMGNVWIAGETVSPNFPLTPNAFDVSFGGETDFGPLRGDAFVSELDPTGSKLLYSTYLGGSAPDAAFAVAVDETGAVYVAGGTSSPNFPTTAGALQAAYSGGASAMFPTGLAGNAFVTKFDSSGHVVYSTFVGTYGTEGTAIAVDPQGQAAINAPAASLMTQATACTGKPATTVLNAAGSAVAAFSSVTGEYLAMDRNGGLYSAGRTTTLAFLSTPHAFQTRYAGAIRMVPQER